MSLGSGPLRYVPQIRLRHLITLTLVATTAALGGCGSDDTPVASTAATTPAEDAGPTKPAETAEAAETEKAESAEKAKGKADEAAAAKSSTQDKPRWVADVDAVCVAHYKRTEGISSAAKGETAEEVNAAMLKAFEPLGKQFVTELQAVSPPADVQPSYDEFISAIQSTFSLLPKTLEAATSGKDESATVSKQYVEAVKVTQAFAAKHDLTGCSAGAGAG